MSDMTYDPVRQGIVVRRWARRDRPLVWLRGEIKTPPFAQTARLEAGYLLIVVAARGISGFRTHGPCRPLDCDATSCGSTMKPPGSFASLKGYTRGAIPMLSNAVSGETSRAESTRQGSSYEEK